MAMATGPGTAIRLTATAPVTATRLTAMAMGPALSAVVSMPPLGVIGSRTKASRRVSAEERLLTPCLSRGIAEFLQPIRDRQVILVAGQRLYVPGKRQGCRWRRRCPIRS